MTKYINDRRVLLTIFKLLFRSVLFYIVNVYRLHLDLWYAFVQYLTRFYLLSCAYVFLLFLRVIEFYRSQRNAMLSSADKWLKGLTRTSPASVIDNIILVLCNCI